ncbi:MAG: chromosomal replication initiation protein [candidate division WS6 bacterium GW2011_GWA2_37_6]|uniref:Chromosomal replication initiator protein DnaA n=1 Tax=candidate division WS6 bacterium GW2011_GWA2_37_6 TaxID=1619087 RepID=A0A0G0K5E6_9BACT|nr:MAG: chromosomal replication initiation protein [candidate division WS6 bacterium GW2011_GWA2_37_6]
MNDLSELWKVALAQIEVKLDSPAQFKTWFKNTKLIDIKKDRAIIGVKNSYASDWLKKKHHKIVKDTITYVYGQELEPEYEVSAELAEIPTEKVSADELIKETPIFGVQDGTTRDLRTLLEKANLNPKYSFSSFISGNSNRIALAAAKAVSERPGEVYLPLFIQGRTGLGKSHLAQAVGREVLERFPDKKVLYTTSEGFLNDMVKSIREGKSLDFRRKYRTCDVLMIDDIQLISKWVETQSEFFNTYNELHNSGRQIILISDRTPDRIDGLEPRLKSRFNGGIVVEIMAPDYEMRMALLEKKSGELGIELPSYITEYIAKEIKDNIRELEGALQKVSLYNSMTEHDLTIEEVARIIGRDHKSKREKIKPASVYKAVAREFEVSVKDIKGPRRTAELALARQISMYLLRQELGYKLEKIAELLNRKDHTTVIHAIDRIESKIKVDEAFKEQIEQLIVHLQNN